MLEILHYSHQIQVINFRSYYKGESEISGLCCNDDITTKLDYFNLWDFTWILTK